MAVDLQRPDIQQLFVRMYERGMHSELFVAHRQKVVSEVAFQARVKICTAGHAILVTFGPHTIIEVMSDGSEGLPAAGQKWQTWLKGSRSRNGHLVGGIEHSAALQIERLPLPLFLQAHQELQMDSLRATLAFTFPAGNRLSPAPMSVLEVESTARSLLVHTTHTFPKHAAIVKTQSLYEFPAR